MTQQYWVGECLVDLSRNQITKGRITDENDPQSLQPKALDVLTWLAKHQGQVVSQDDLFDNVWTGTVVSPNTLQRCIAQLRKALGDDSKQQKVIKTHAKKGYSLECPVRWDAASSKPGDQSQQNEYQEAESLKETPSESAPTLVRQETSQKSSQETVSNEKLKDQDTSAKPFSKTLNVSAIAVLTVVLVAAVLLLSNWQSTEPDYQLNIADMRPITSTDNRELASIYSPDGEYVVFKRFPDVMCISHLWAKNLTTQQEYRLTQTPGSYGRLSFSADGSTLAFVKQEDCTDTLNREMLSQKTCYQLQSLDFSQAMNSPVTPNVHMECVNSEIRHAKWLNSQDIALLQMRAGRWQLIRYSVNQNLAKTIFAPESGNLIHYDYSPSLNVIALISLSDDHQLFINMLTPEGDLLSSHAITFPEEIARYSHIYPNFSALDNSFLGGRLIFSTGRQLFTLSETGEISNISVPLDKAMGTPVFHPDGKRMLAIKGFYDSDIVSVPVEQFTNIAGSDSASMPGDQNFQYEVIDRSAAGEYFASVQSGGDLMAFMSYRSGTSQLWLKESGLKESGLKENGLKDGQGATQLSQFPIDTYIDGFVWAADGKSLLVNASSELTQIYLDGRVEHVLPELPVSELFDWDSNASIALAKVRISGVMKFVEIDLSLQNVHQQNVRILNDKKVVWAQMLGERGIIYMDHLHRFWRPDSVEDKLIPELDGQGSDKRFVIKHQILYGINDDFQLWTYDLHSNQLKVIANLPDTIDYINDAEGDRLLMTIRVAARKDVVEMRLR